MSSFDPHKRMLVLAALSMAPLALGSCTGQLADVPIVGTPADAPARPKEAGAYLPVNDLPRDRDDTQMDAATRDKLKAELIAARNRQATATKDAGAKDAAAAKDAAGK
jgi:hypothetical protein